MIIDPHTRDFSPEVVDAVAKIIGGIGQLEQHEPIVPMTDIDDNTGLSFELERKLGKI